MTRRLPPTMLTTEDCQRCGACCVNPRENVAEGAILYVEIDRTDAILRRRDLVKKLVVLDEDGAPHLKLGADGRCLALSGALGRSVRCSIYHHRPSPCRRVEPGSRECLARRAEIGLGERPEYGPPSGAPR